MLIPVQLTYKVLGTEYQKTDHLELLPSATVVAER